MIVNPQFLALVTLFVFAVSVNLIERIPFAVP